MIGRTLSHFRILARIGKGGMGVVYRAQDERLRRAVALKVLPPDLVANEERRLRFLREARAAAAIGHPNIATIYEVDEADGVVFIAMELVEGKTLRELIGGRPMPVEEALRIATGIAEGLAEAHKAKIVHRDLKPENVMVGTGRQVKILDFGLAKVIEEQVEVRRSQLTQADTVSRQLTREKRVLGTAAYMSPEQARGDRVDTRSDLFSFGSTLYEMVTGRAPFRGGNDIETLSAILREPAAPASRSNTDVPGALDNLIGRCLEKDPKDRYQDTQELVEGLERIRRATEAYSSPLWSPILRGARRLRRWVTRPLLIVPALALLLAAILFFFVEKPPGQPPAPPAPRLSPNTIAVLPFTVRGNEEAAYLYEGMVDLLSTKLDGAGDLRSVDPHVLIAFVKRQGGGDLDPARGRVVAEQLGAGLYILGGIVAAGDRIHINGALYGSADEGEVLAQAAVEGVAEELFTLVDDLAAGLIADRVEGSGDRLTRIASDTTESFPALKAYLLGQSHARAGRFEQAVEAYQEAIAQDPTFALAYWRMHFASGVRPSATVKIDREVALAKALEHRDRLPEHDRRALEAYHIAWTLGNAEEAVRIYRDILGNSPEDVETWWHLGEVLLHYGKTQGLYLDEAREAFERALAYDPDHWPSVGWLGWLAGIQERYEEVAAITEREFELAREGDYAPIYRAQLAFAKGDTAAQAEAIEEFRFADDNKLSFAAGNVAMYHGHIEGSARLFRLLTAPSRSPEARMEGFISLAHLDLARGRWNDAKGHLSAAESLDPTGSLKTRAVLSLFPLLQVPRAELEALREEISRFDYDPVWSPIYRAYFMGLLSARLDDPSAALQYAEELEAIRRRHASKEGKSPRTAAPFARDLAHSVRADVARMLGDLTGALEEIDKTRPQDLWTNINPDLYDSESYEKYMLAMLLEEHGQHDEALRWYSSLGQAAFEDIVYEAPKHLRMGEIYERLGNDEKAIEHYARFVDLWKDCDPEFRSLVDDAESRLAQLRSNN
jgi:tetratricopeptide (TPR) repeat protein/predicted Ser/Thr protein kinase